MKTAIGISTLLTSMIGLVAATSQSGAWYYGKRLARAMWNEGIEEGFYDCSEHDDVLGIFKEDVEFFVYEECKERYSRWNRMIGDCKDGADAFVIEQAAECHDPIEDCTGLASAAAGGVAAKFCELNLAQFISAPTIWPAGCVETAKDKCKAQVLDEVHQIAKTGGCGDLESIADLSMSDRSDLKDWCDDEVEALAEEPVRK